MYLNQIQFNSKSAAVFVSSEEIFTPHNPVFKAVQEALERIGFKPKDNHNWTIDGNTLSLLHGEKEFLNLVEWKQTWPAEMNGYYQGEWSKLLNDIQYIFIEGIPAETVKDIIK